MKRLALVVVMLSVVGVVGCGKDKVTNPPVATRRTVTVDAVGRVGEWTSLALDGQGNPRISDLDESNYGLKYAAKNGEVWTLETVEAGSVGWFTSLALDGQGNPCISYQDAGNGDLMYASWGVH